MTPPRCRHHPGRVPAAGGARVRGPVLPRAPGRVPLLGAGHPAAAAVLRHQGNILSANESMQKQPNRS